MVLRTPRRRISPRTKHRYRVIKEFVRRALRGTSSQPSTKTNSSVEVSVSDLKSQILCIEQQLNKVSKHYQDLNCLENTFIKESQNSREESHRHEGSIINQDNCEIDSNDLDASASVTKLLYKSSTSQQRKSDENQDAVNNRRHDNTTEMASSKQRIVQTIQNSQFKSNNNYLRKARHEARDINIGHPERTRHAKYKAVGSIYPTSSFHSLLESGYNKHYKTECSGQRHKKRHTRKEYTEPFILKEQRDGEKEKYLLGSHRRGNDDKYKIKRTKRVYSEVDKDFISEIIRRQYRPVKLFGRRDSDFSQFSAPVCRDQEFTVHNGIQEGIELCSCCFDECEKKRYRPIHHSDPSDTRSICDTRLYSSKKHKTHKLKRDCVEDYNNSILYDVVPVKEKSSPKARKKFTEENMIAYQCLKEVPPSPRTHRPRLNLKVQQYANYEDCLCKRRHRSRKNSPTRPLQNIASNEETDVSSISDIQRLHTEKLNSGQSQKPIPIYEDVGTMSNLQCPNYGNEQVSGPNNDTTINTQFTDSTTDKTDKALCEIKDILRTFLLEIKKESISSGRSDETSKIENKQLTQDQGTKTNSNIIPNSGHSFNNYGVGQCGMPPYVSPIVNPCCYPILPMCPMNCMQNGYIIPSPSYACALCAKNSKEHGCPGKDSPYDNKPCEEVNKNNETQELIKEIYKFVSQKPKSPRTEDCGNEANSARSKQNHLSEKVLTNRYVGGSIKGSKHDANVGTPHLKYYSKSCEAIGSRIVSDTYNANASYSDTVLEKLSLEATQSSTETDISSDVPGKKVRRTKVKKVFDPWRLFRKKKKKDVIEELSESESTVEVEVKPRAPFKQHIQSYVMHGAEYCQPPAARAPPCCVPHGRDCCHGYGPGTSYQHCHDIYKNPLHHEHTPTLHHNPKYRPASPYPNYDHYNQIPQVPLCLKEVEVKSIGTQSERKVSILQKLANKMPTAVQQGPEATRFNAPIKEKPNFWKMLQEKAKQTDNDTADFSLKIQKRLAQGDIKMKNAMMKKLFYKKNPFSPRNLIVRTLLGKDKSSYGNPPKMYRPRMFI